MYLLIVLPVYDYPGRDYTTIYMSDPIALEFETRDISSISSSDCGYKIDESLKHAANGVLISLTFYILNIYKTFSIFHFLFINNLAAFFISLNIHA